MTPSCPNWLRVRAPASTSSTLLKLLNATERFTVGFSAIVNCTIAGADAPAFFVHDPRTVGDWLNLLQLGVDWVLLLLFFILCLTYPPSHSPYASQVRILVAVLYTAFTLISVVPLFTDALFPSIFHEPGERQLNFGVAILMGFHLFFLNTIFTLLSICSIIPQAVQFRSPPLNSGVVRVRNCALQGVVLAMIAVSWVFRVKLPDGVNVLTPFRSIIWEKESGWEGSDRKRRRNGSASTRNKSSLTRAIFSLWDVLSIPMHIFPDGQGTSPGALARHDEEPIS
ncbi:uncharacterized protein BO87DRAFT_415391 [Aspergillus neoniger CBS 115656]|uniref:Uncharacterized protein n=1 Tax=Aspergillus neoniger (strain CBS 115656) TaxID=1448310 RepID=A0A318YKV2_ASPNB|nr:hypothetical protein BO87DRAFT_415391 [Aspergillus neoniger CBS 115656]PYH35185.1 hypothetical protein BO87DRAFT_415391 [Aspergillus neoniger CBS 115656]